MTIEDESERIATLALQELYMCGAGTHPGGGVIGAPGYNAAREVLRDVNRDE